tara:strand:- start:3018 stop:3443 length:426 start_codon:yes stop_codon:yes gene_type:complete
MGPDIWGPHGWKFLHFVSLGYPDNPTIYDKKKYKTFFTLIKDILPCSLCALNYKNHIKATPLSDEILNDKNKLISWCIKMHNLVNIENNSKVYSDEDALKLIVKEKSCKNKSDNNGTEYLIAILLLLLLLMVVFYKNLKKN